MRKLIALTLLISLFGAAQLNDSRAQQRRQQQQQSRGGSNVAPATLIRNATILTVSNGTLQNSDILIRGGKIAAVGQNLTAPSGARVIDATGKYVMPGIIDCHSHTMIDAVNEGTVSVSSMVNVKDVLNPTDIDIYR